jgi:RNA polymerase sigma factor (sigma-70 family)
MASEPSEESRLRDDPLTILRNAVTGELQAEEALFTRLRAELLHVIHRAVLPADREDVLQQTLLTVHEKYRARLAHPSMWMDYQHFVYWCRRILRNHIGNYLRKQRAQATRLHTMASISGPTPESPDLAYERAQLESVVHRAFGTLTDRQRASMSARVTDAARLRIASSCSEQGAAYARLYRARQKLVRALAQEGWKVSRTGRPPASSSKLANK